MTNPNHEGDVEVGVQFDASNAPRELEDAIEDAGDRAEPRARETGRNLGHEVGRGLGDGIRREAPRIRSELEDVTNRVRLRYRIMFDRSTGNYVRRGFYEMVENAAEEAFEGLTREGGPLQQIGRGLADAVGAGFNVSGRSPLIAVLVPAIGALITAIGALVVGLQSAGALLLSFPALLTSVGIQIGVVALAFGGIADNISAAFAAQNPKQLNEALRNLRPSAREFVKELLPLKNLFSDIRAIIEADFFRALGTNIGDLIRALDPIVRVGFRDVALALGSFFHELVDLLASPIFTNFIQGVFEATVQWIKDFGPAFLQFLKGLLVVGDALLPFLTDFGKLFSGIFYEFGLFLQDLVESGEFADFMESAYEITKSLFDLLTVGSRFVATFVSALATAGGKKLIDVLVEGLQELIFFFSSPVGILALKGFIDLLVLLTQVFFGLIIAITIVGGIIGGFIDLIGWVITEGLPFLFNAMVAFFEWLFTKAIDIYEWVRSLPFRIGKWLAERAKDVKDNILGWFKNAGEWLVDKGKEIVGGLIRGMNAKRILIGLTADSIASVIGSRFPSSPVKEGPLSGHGEPYKSGQRIVQSLAMGMASEAGTLANVSNNTAGNINFGPGAIRVEYNGVTPTPEQARITGSAIGSGISAQLAQRRVVGAIRTL